jgi:hypothetical protein
MRLPVLGSVILLALFTNACGQGDATHSAAEAPFGSVEQPLAVSPSALLVVGNPTLAAGDAALRTRLQTLGFAVTVRSGIAVTAPDAAGKVVIVSESVTSGDVNTKLRNVAVPVIALESALFDDFGLVDSSAQLGTQGSQTSLTLVAPSGAPSGDVTVTVTSSAQTFSWANPVASASRLATVAGDSSRSTIFAFEKGSALSGLTAPARRAGWFATAAAPTAFNANAWSLFDGLLRWASAGLPQACTSDSDCSGAACVNGFCSTACPAGQVACSGACVDISSTSSNCGACGVACASGQTCQNGACSSACAAGSSSCAGVCVNTGTNTSNCGACGVVCPTGKTCQAGSCQ